MGSNEETPAAPSAATNTLTLDYWEGRWTDNMSGWHEVEGNKLLWENLDQLVETNFPGVEKASLKVFVPLCGKTYDMYRLYKEGYTVVGVEFASQPIGEFFSENSIEVNSEVSAPYTASRDGRMTIGQGDLFTFGVDESAEHKLPHDGYDIIWDRGSLVAMNAADRSKYTQLMLSVLAPNFLYLIDVFDYDTSVYGGPPLAVSQQDLEGFFGSVCKIEHIASADYLKDRPRFQQKGLKEMTEQLYSMTRK